MSSTTNAASAERPAAAAPKPKELKVEDALLYLDQVKMEFSDKPHIYNEFLDIMKNFKAQTIDTPGVIERVKNLFRGYNKLILGFNTFLPEVDGYKIELTDDEQSAGQASNETKMVVDEAVDSAASGAGFSKPQQFQQRNAINYVTKIRNRFQNEQATYQAFLKILYKYQQDQKGIKDVLEQVSQLFGDHPDLLDEFAQFLPDGVQEQARARLSRAAKEAEERKLHQRQFAMHNSQLGKRPRDVKVSAQTLANNARKQAAMVAQHQAQLNASRKNARRRLDDDRRKDQYSHISTSAERLFFDQVKDYLTSSTASKDSWVEFVKLLELFASDSITKREFFSFVFDLFGSNAELYDEFTRLMASRADYEAQGSDVWFAIPLSEIDFSQCRKCTPSYRALPKDYPKPQCTERSETEQAALNDQWVSIPIGSEESNSFKHMRKNQYEEALFKCEDDRFEIDLIIDSNTCTIRMLEPIEEEIANLKALEDGGDGSSPRFSFQLEKRNLSTIHLNSISRLYGDHGNEILELLRKNPAGTIPILIRRMRQKDLEWRKARQDLNRQWKEVLERNWDKSFDHRSFYFRSEVLKHYSSKHLLAEIRGTLSESKGGESLHDVVPGVHTTLPSAAWSSLMGDMNPNLYLSYPNIHHSVHKDIYRIVCYAIESANIPTTDREKIMALWRDLVRMFFNIPVHYLYGELQKNITLEKSIDSVPLDPSETWPVSTKVLTVYGSGTVLAYRRSDSSYVVQLAFGTAYMKAYSIIGAEELSSTAMAAIGVSNDSANVTKIYNNLQSTGGATVKEPCRSFLGTQICYIFLRLHHTLFARLCSARELALAQLEKIADAEKNQTPLSPGIATSSQAHMEIDDDEGATISGAGSTPKPSYMTFIGHLSSLVDGSMDSARYEEQCRSLLGNSSYVVYTLDKLMQHLVSSLQKMANDDNVSKLVGLFVYHKTRGQHAGVDTSLYVQHCAALIGNTEEIFRFQLLAAEEGMPASGDTLVACQILGALSSTIGIGSAADGSTSTHAEAAAAST